MLSAPSSKLSALALIVIAFGGLATGCTMATTAPTEGSANDTAVSPLGSSDHSSITGDTCRAAGLPEAFCLRVGEEAVNVDRNEWTTLPAHAQKDLGQSTCDGVGDVQARLHSLGGEVRAILGGGNPSPDAVNDLAKALGRSLHTIQDNCAHSGMTNEQHSWLSNREVCVADNQSPDKDPEALKCAREESSVIMGAFNDAVVASKIDPNALSAATEITTHNPSRHQICGFVHQWEKFDGVDTRWNAAKTREAFRKTLVEAFVADEAPAELCADGEDALASATPRGKVEVTDPSCGGISLYCVGE